MNNCKDLIINVGVDTKLFVDLTLVDFSEISEIKWVVKNYPAPSACVVLDRTFNTADLHEIMITAEESYNIEQSAVYQFLKVMHDGTIRAASPVKLLKVVNALGVDGWK